MEAIMRFKTIRTSLLLLCTAITLLPLLLLWGVVLMQTGQMQKVAMEESLNLAYADLDHILSGVVAMVRAQQELLQLNITANLAVATERFHQTGKVGFSRETNSVKAVDQATGDPVIVDLPRMELGGRWIGFNDDPAKPSPVVDDVEALVGGAATIFQRMNKQGDMLRIVTNVKTADKKRAVGTYIAAAGADGKPNAVVAAVLRKEKFVGRAQVVGKWYTAAYEPILDGSGEVVGMLFAGVPEEATTAIRDQIMATKVGKTGYVYVLDAQGRYIISQGGERGWGIALGIQRRRGQPLHPGDRQEGPAAQAGRDNGTEVSLAERGRPGAPREGRADRVFRRLGLDHRGRLL
jgi:methyl-accepting chemotaxis protein